MDLSRAKAVTARVHPHGSGEENMGPLDVRIGVASQPPMLKQWRPSRTNPVRFHMEQPDEEKTNLTMLRLLFSNDGETPSELGDVKWHMARVYRKVEVKMPRDFSEQEKEVWRRMTPATLNIRLKTRHVKQMKHPVPCGPWQGTCIDDPNGTWVLITIQAVTLSVVPTEEPRRILIPGDAGFEPPPEHQGIVH